MKTILFVLFSITVQAADAPTLTPEQKLSVREAQLAVASNRAEIAEMESHLKDLYAQRPVLQKNFDTVKMSVTPEGWKLQSDLTLERCKFTEEPGCKPLVDK